MKHLSLLLITLLTSLMALGEPANPTPVTITQPNGEQVQVVLVGDEYYSFNTTVDGYTIVNESGTWEYATLQGHQLVATGIQAHDPDARSTQEEQLLASIGKRLIDRSGVEKARKSRATRDAKSLVQQSPVVDYGKFRGLIILINYNDKKFGMSNPNDFYNKLCNTKNYTGFTHNGSFQSCTGSVRDYFYDNSMGQFDPTFDVVGPINLDYSCLDGRYNHREIFQAAMDAVDDEVDFSRYDADNDGQIDMVFFMVAGYSASYSGNNGSYLWPHMSYLYGYNGEYYYYLEYDGKRMGRYASSCEIYGWEASGYTVPNAIGTVCHEFGHVLGLPDLYDTDYSDSGGTSNHPGGWDVMASGSSNNYGRTPVGYSLWERVELGFAEAPAELSPGLKQLQPVSQSNAGLMMSTPNDKEYFLFENRQAIKWDSALPGHGLLITRVDRSDQRVWYNNEVNCNPARNYYELVRASGTGASTTAFPGSAGVYEISSVTTPALTTWDGMSCAYALKYISEYGSTVAFNVVDDVPPSAIVENFDSMPLSTTDVDADVMGTFGTWKFLKAKVVEDEFGNKCCSLAMPGGVEMTSDVALSTFKVTASVTNKSSVISKVQLQYSLDEGATWTTVGTENAAASSTSQLTWTLSLDKPARFKIARSSGSKTVAFTINDITIYYTDMTVYNLLVAGEAVNGANCGNIAPEAGAAGVIQYLPVSGTLRLKDAVIETGGATAGLTVGLETLPITLQGAGNSISASQVAIMGNNSAITISGADGAILKLKGGTGATSKLSALTLTSPLTIVSPVGAHFYGGSIVGSGGNIITDWVTIKSAAAIDGDVNGDGVVTSADVTALYNLLLNNDSSGVVNGDVNGDGTINSGDVTAVYNIIMGG